MTKGASDGNGLPPTADKAGGAGDLEEDNIDNLIDEEFKIADEK